MLRITIGMIITLASIATATAQTMTLSTSSADYQVTNIFSDVDFFDINIEINAPLAPGAYMNPDIVSVTYQVTGVLTSGTPSGFPAFDLQRSMTGAEFYAQGSSLSFEIAQSAVLTDGVQVIELVGNGITFEFNGREIGNGRFHPALMELNANGTGRIQNSNNVITVNPDVEVAMGSEYINDLVFDPGNTTLITGVPVQPIPPVRRKGGGTFSPAGIAALILFGIYGGIRRRKQLAALMYRQKVR